MKFDVFNLNYSESCRKNLIFSLLAYKGIIQIKQIICFKIRCHGYDLVNSGVFSSSGQYNRRQHNHNGDRVNKVNLHYILKRIGFHLI